MCFSMSTLSLITADFGVAGQLSVSNAILLLSLLRYTALLHHIVNVVNYLVY